MPIKLNLISSLIGIILLSSSAFAKLELSDDAVNKSSGNTSTNPVVTKKESFIQRLKEKVGNKFDSAVCNSGTICYIPMNIENPEKNILKRKALPKLALTKISSELENNDKCRGYYTLIEKRDGIQTCRVPKCTSSDTVVYADIENCCYNAYRLSEFQHETKSPVTLSASDWNTHLNSTKDMCAHYDSYTQGQLVLPAATELANETIQLNTN